ncbi:Type II secretory pathway, pullulanase PulA [Roseovarius salis]|uniref:Type II secretory pathway, pullulanase PulA n=1 Tax=Roseovarius salis TaxID=3376063 RepID=UPI0037CAFAE5
MIISPGRNYIFVHIPKTGGTSLSLALEGRAMKDDILIGDTPKARKRRRRLRGARAAGRLWKHSTLADIEGLVSREFVAGAFVVTMVRNPWDRAVSYYRWLRVQGFDHPAVRAAKASDFSGFLNTRHTRNALRANPCGRYVTRPDGVEHCNAFIRLERFETDAAPLWDHLGFRLRLPRCNASDRRADYRGYYSDADAALLAELCAEDIRRFDYDFG